MMNTMERWIFEVMQGGIVVAGGDCPDQTSAKREASHYVMMYGQDGPCEAIVRQPADREAKRLGLAIMQKQRDRGDNEDMIRRMIGRVDEQETESAK